MTKTTKKLIVAIVAILATSTAAGAGIHLIAGETGNAVGKDSAKEIALAHAGLSESEVTLKKVELERDDGRTEYEVEFRKDGVKYEYEIDAESGEIVSFDKDGKQSATTDADGAPVEAPAVTAEQAKAVALEHAGFAESEVTFTKVKLERDDGTDEYEVVFYKDSVKYEYDIDAESGEIRSYDSEFKKSEINASAAPDSTDGTSAAPPVVPPAETGEANEKLSAEKAKVLVLVHAGLSESDVTFTKVKLERDDGRYEYEIEFRCGGFEYEYELDAESGKILDFEKEYDD